MSGNLSRSPAEAPDSCIPLIANNEMNGPQPLLPCYHSLVIWLRFGLWHAPHTEV